MISVFFWKDNTCNNTFVEYGMVFGVTNSSNPTLWDSGIALAGLLDLHSRLKLWRSGHESPHLLQDGVRHGIQADAKDLVGLHQKLDSCMDPMDPEGHPDGSIVNIASRKLAPASVNVDNALIIGQAIKRFWEGLAREVSLHQKMWAWQYHSKLFRLVTQVYDLNAIYSLVIVI